jgi:hypothetical protein
MATITKKTHRYTIRGYSYEYLGFSREDVRRLAALLEQQFPQVDFDIVWRDPVAHALYPLVDPADLALGETEDLEIEIIRICEEWHDAQ